ncbi:hypothetical protein D9M69_622920 [compost metagenome]
MNNEIEKLLASQKETFSNAAEELWHGTVGEHVEKLLAKGQELSLEAVRASLQATKEDEALHALLRLKAEKALEKLASITPSLP